MIFSLEFLTCDRLPVIRDMKQVKRGQSGLPNRIGKTMPPKPQDQSSNDLEQQERQQLNAKIGDHVMRTLGQPSDLHRLQIRRLWKDHYRVNVLVGVDVVSTKVANSYFVVADGDGNIVRSNPKITREYRPLTSALAVDKGTAPAAPSVT